MSRKLKLILGLLILVAGFLIARLGLYFKEGIENASNANPPTVLSAEIENPLLKDTDKDGIPDFEEANYNTDPFDPDSDNDGYLDGEEVLSGFNPMYDENIEQRIPQQPENITSNFLNNLMAGIYAGDLKPSSAKFAESIDMVALAVIDDSFQVLRDPIPQDGFQTTDNSKESQEKYLKDVDSLLGGSFLRNFLAQGSIMQRAVQEIIAERPEEASKIFKDYSLTVTGAYTRLLSVPVPPKWEPFHAQLLATFRRMAIGHSVLANIEEDPLLALTALNDLPNTLIDLDFYVIQDLRQLIKEENLSVPDSELFQVLDLLDG